MRIIMSKDRHPDGVRWADGVRRAPPLPIHRQRGVAA